MGYPHRRIIIMFSQLEWSSSVEFRARLITLQRSLARGYEEEFWVWRVERRLLYAMHPHLNSIVYLFTTFALIWLKQRLKLYASNRIRLKDCLNAWKMNLNLTIFICRNRNVIGHCSVTLYCESQHFHWIFRELFQACDVKFLLGWACGWVEIAFFILSLLVEDSVPPKNSVNKSLWNLTPDHHKTGGAGVVRCHIRRG